jgi:phage baseplate assembly protein W
MANTTSWNFPNIFNVAQNTVSVKEDEASIANRVRLLILTEPTEVYNDVNQGVGLKKYIGRYNDINVRTELKSKIIEKLRMYEPDVIADKTLWSDELEFTNTDNNIDTGTAGDKLNMTIALQTVYGTVVTVDLSSYVSSL